MNKEKAIRSFEEVIYYKKIRRRGRILVHFSINGCEGHVLVQTKKKTRGTVY